MFQNSNSLREISYIFLWLIGIIFFYGLVHTFLLEPSTSHAAVAKNEHTAQSLQTKTDTTTASKKESSHILKPITTPPVLTRVSTPVHAVKAPKQESKTAEAQHLAEVRVPIKVPALPTVAKPVTLMSTTTEKPLETVTKPQQAVKTQSVQEIQTLSGSVKTPVQQTQTMAVSTVNKALSPVIKAPSVPTVPTVISTVSTPVQVMSVTQVQAMEVNKKSVVAVEKKNETKEVPTTKATDTNTTIEKAYDRDENMRLLEKARQQIMEKAEADRAEAMRGLGR